MQQKHCLLSFHWNQRDIEWHKCCCYVIIEADGRWSKSGRSSSVSATLFVLKEQINTEREQNYLWETWRNDELIRTKTIPAVFILRLIRAAPFISLGLRGASHQGSLRYTKKDFIVFWGEIWNALWHSSSYCHHSVPCQPEKDDVQVLSPSLSHSTL